MMKWIIIFILLFQFPLQEWNKLDKGVKKEVVKLIISDFFTQKYWCSKAKIKVTSDGKDIFFTGKCYEREI